MHTQDLLPSLPTTPSRPRSVPPPTIKRDTYPAVAQLPRRVNALGVDPLHGNGTRKDIGQVGNVAAKDVLVQRVVDGPTPAAAGRGQATTAYSKQEKKGACEFGSGSWPWCLMRRDKQEHSCMQEPQMD